MTEHSPITPPPKLVQQWLSEFYGSPTVHLESNLHIANLAAQWGADQELEECCKWLASKAMSERKYPELRAARRKPPSLKEQALEIVKGTPVDSAGLYSYEHVEIIRRALEALPDD